MSHLFSPSLCCCIITLLLRRPPPWLHLTNANCSGTCSSWTILSLCPCCPRTRSATLRPRQTRVDRTREIIIIIIEEEEEEKSCNSSGFKLTSGRGERETWKIRWDTHKGSIKIYLWGFKNDRRRNISILISYVKPFSFFLSVCDVLSSAKPRCKVKDTKRQLRERHQTMKTIKLSGQNWRARFYICGFLQTKKGRLSRTARQCAKKERVRYEVRFRQKNRRILLLLLRSPTHCDNVRKIERPDFTLEI